MKKLMASALAAAMVVSLAGCGGSKTAATGETGSAAATSESASTESVLNTDTSTLYINLASEPDRLDPALNRTVDGAVLAVNSFVGLLTYDENGQLVPGVAESYDVSEDGMTYTFHLRQSKWSDGTDLTAKDFVYSWNRAANPMTAADYSYLFDGLIAKNEAAEEMVANPEYDAAAAEAAAASGEEYSTPAEVYSDAALAEQEANNILVGVEATDDYTLTVTLVSPCPYCYRFSAVFP